MIASVRETYAAITGRSNGKRVGRELFVPCVNPTAHKNGDADPSLRINESKDTWHCPVCDAGGKSIVLVIHAGLAHGKGEALTWMRERGLADDEHRQRRVQRFVYDGAEGEHFTNGAVDRIEPGYGGQAKTFVQYRKLPNGQYAKGLRGKKLPLYRRPELLQACIANEMVFMVEGELKADRLSNALREAGSKSAVTTIAGGAKARLVLQMATDLRGAKNVVILPDADEPGRQAARLRADVILRECPALDAQIVELFPDRSDGSDIHDWLDDGHTIDDLLARCSATQPEHNRLAAPTGESRLLSFDELNALPDETCEWLVDGLLIAGGTSLVVSKPKVGKSVTLRNLAFAVAHGTPFLGQATKQGVVIYMALEDKRKNIVDHFRNMGVQFGCNLLFWIGRSPENAVQWLADVLRERTPVLIIVDPLQRLLHLPDTNDYAKVSNATDPLIHLARSSGAHLALAHHAGKGDDYMGSTAFFAAVDTKLHLRKNKSAQRIAESDQRYGDNLEEIVLELDRVTGLVTVAGSLTDVERDAASEKIIKLLTAKQTWMKHADIVEAVEARAEVTGSALAALSMADTIQRNGLGKKGSPFQYAVPGVELPNADQSRPLETSDQGSIGFDNSIPGIYGESKNQIQKPALNLDGQTDYSIPKNAPLPDGAVISIPPPASYDL